MKLTAQQLLHLRGATFSLLDDAGHPVGCGFFVTACGVALTAAHVCVHARSAGDGSLRLRASTYGMQEFELLVVTPKLGELDVAVLRIIACAALPPPHESLPLPKGLLAHEELLSAPVLLIHGSIAWSAPSAAPPDRISSDNGYVITTSDTMLLYSVSTYKGHSGAALLFRRGSVIGLHSGGFNDLDQEQSEHSPSTSGEAVRLDLPQIRVAVQAAMAPAAAPAAVAGSARRRGKSKTR